MYLLISVGAITIFIN